MLFYRLGAQSAWRNIMRSLLALLAMAMAAGFLTNVVSLSRGYAAMLKADYRSFQGGEIIAYATQFKGRTPGEEELWEYRKLLTFDHSDLQILKPELFEQGYLATEKSKSYFTAEEMQQLAELEGIDFIYPRYQIPAYSQNQNSMWYTPLRGRDFSLDEKQEVHLRQLTSEGRWFSPDDEGEYVAVIAASHHFPLGQRNLSIGDTMKVLVPHIFSDNPEGGVDFTQGRVIEFRIIGLIEVEADYAMLDEIQIPLTTWQQIWTETGGEAYYPQQVALRCNDMLFLNDTVATLQNSFPQFSIFGVPEIVWQAADRHRVENFWLYEAGDQGSQEIRSQDTIGMDLRLPIAILIFCNAALVIASNLLIMVNERRTEVGILKAVGAMKREVVTMVLAEAMIISGIGALIGFAFFRIPAILNQLIAGISIWNLLSSVVMDLTVVFASTGVATLLFALIPARRMSGLSVQEVLQSE